MKGKQIATKYISKQKGDETIEVEKKIKEFEEEIEELKQLR